MSSSLRVAVFSLDRRNHACAVLRLDSPLHAAKIAELRWAVSAPQDGVFTVDTRLHGIDVIVVQRLFPHPNASDLMEFLFDSRLPVIYELDDLLTDLPATNLHAEVGAACRPHVLDAIRRADLVTVSTPGLEEAYRPFNPEIRVLPNALDVRLFQGDADPARPRGRERGPLRIAYTGTPTHRDDLQMIERALCRVQERYGDSVRFYFMGCVTERLARLPGAELVELEYDYRRYAGMLSASEIDIAVVPLRDNPFNRCKSNIKWLEYGICGIPALFSDLPPYRDSVANGETGILVPDDEQAWIDAISRLVEEPEQRASIASRAAAEVRDRYSVERHCGLFRETYEAVSRRRRSMRTSPRASVIIPVFNRVELTRDCIAALRRTVSPAELELVVVDNASSDGTADYLASLDEAVRVVRNTRNLGFAAACNQGASVASSERLLFLNNDTVPREGWLDPLLRELDRHRDVGIVGSKLLYADGTVQHAGVAFALPDAVPYHLYRGLAADHSAVSRRREFRAVTGACMLVRRSLFECLGGFDQGYLNGFEDIDLCLRAVEFGSKIVYQPESAVVHLEEQSAGRKDHDEENLLRLLQSWAGRIFPDEVGHLLEDGFVTRSSPEGRRRWLEPVPDGAARESWERVAQMERRVAASGLRTLALLPPAAASWPDDPAALCWGAQLCTWSELAEPAEEFRRRLAALGETQAASAL